MFLGSHWYLRSIPLSLLHSGYKDINITGFIFSLILALSGKTDLKSCFLVWFGLNIKLQCRGVFSWPFLNDSVLLLDISVFSYASIFLQLYKFIIDRWGWIEFKL